MQSWQVHKAKVRFSELIRDAATEGPQTITIRGRRAAIVQSSEDYERLACGERQLVEFPQDRCPCSPVWCWTSDECGRHRAPVRPHGRHLQLGRLRRHRGRSAEPMDGLRSAS